MMSLPWGNDVVAPWGNSHIRDVWPEWVSFQAEHLWMGVNFLPKICRWVIILIEFYLGMGGFPQNGIKPTVHVV